MKQWKTMNINDGSVSIGDLKSKIYDQKLCLFLFIYILLYSFCFVVYVDSSNVKNDKNLLPKISPTQVKAFKKIY